MGYLSAIAIDSIQRSDSNGATRTLYSTLFTNTLTTWCTWVAITIVAVYILVLPQLERKVRNRRPDQRLRDLYRSQTDSVFRGHETEGISWGLGQTVMASHDLHLGWTTEQIVFEYDSTPFRFADESDPSGPLRGRNLHREYQTYLAEEFPKLWTTDNRRLMLVKKPVSMTDNPTLGLELRRTSWSQLQFFWTKVLDEENRSYFIDQIFEGPRIPFPNSMVLHLVIVTNDNKVLLTEANSNKSNDHPKTWAMSIGEQLDENDLSADGKESASRWIERALYEELLLEEGPDYDSDAVNFLAITLEGDIVNLALVARVTLRIDSDDLMSRIQAESRPDNEFTNLEFISIDDLPKLLFDSSFTLHPSTPIRLLYAYRNIRGRGRLKAELLRLSRQSSL